MSVFNEKVLHRTWDPFAYNRQKHLSPIAGRITVTVVSYLLHQLALLKDPAFPVVILSF
jgi:hypothetical protein